MSEYKVGDKGCWYEDGSFGPVKEANEHYVFRQEVE